MSTPSSNLQLDDKYRPKSLDRIIGHEAVVTRLKGIITSQKYPNSMLFTGPSSCGKTTLARAFVADLFGIQGTPKGHPDFAELNSADSRGIDDMRKMLSVARLRPRSAPRRVFLFDEAQGFTGDAARLLLKPLEEPPPGTLFILGSMEPEKLDRAMKNRTSQFALKAPGPAELTKYVKRIVKGEKITYLNEEVITQVVQNSNGEMRTAAHLLQGLEQMAAGRGKAATISKEDVLQALESLETKDDALAVEVLASVYKKQMTSVYRRLLDVEQGFTFINKLLGLNRFLINNTVLKGERHRAVWWSENNKLIHTTAKATVPENKALSCFTAVHSALINLKRESMTFTVNEIDLIGHHLALAVRELSRLTKE